MSISSGKRFPIISFVVSYFRFICFVWFQVITSPLIIFIFLIATLGCILQVDLPLCFFQPLYGWYCTCITNLQFLICCPAIISFIKSTSIVMFSCFPAKLPFHSSPLILKGLYVLDFYWDQILSSYPVVIFSNICYHSASQTLVFLLLCKVYCIRFHSSFSMSWRLNQVSPRRYVLDLSTSTLEGGLFESRVLRDFQLSWGL